MPADRKIFIEVEFDDKGARAKLVELDRATDRVAATAGGKATAGMGALERAMARASTVGNILGRVITDTAYAVGRFLVDAFTRAISLSAEFNNAMIGLGSIARAFGADAQAAQLAAKNLASDGLMTVGEAATALKNMLSTGFGLPEAITIINRFKDTAAFGRQASFDFGTAVVRATEGIRLGLSNVSDAAGMTKNLSQILKENGKSLDDVSRISSDASVRMALFKGIIKETAPQLGDASRLLGTYSGALARLKTAWDMVLIGVGNAITQNSTLATLMNRVADALSSASIEITASGSGLDFVSNTIVRVLSFGARLLSFFGLVVESASFVARTVYSVAIALGELGKATANVLAMASGGVFTPWGRALAEAHGELDTAVAKLHEWRRAAGEAGQDAAERFGRWSREAKALADELGATAGRTIELGVATTGLRDNTNGAGETQKELNKRLKEMADVEKSRTVWDLAESMQALRQGIFDVELHAEEGVRGLNTLDATFRALADDTIPSFQDEIERLRYSFVEYGPTLEQAERDFQKFGDYLKTEFPRAILGAIQGGGSILRTVGGGILGNLFSGSLGKSITGGLSKALGSALGGALGSILPGLGTMLGAGLGGLLGKLFGGSEESRLVNRPRQLFIDAAGGLAELNRQVMNATGSLTLVQRLLNAKTEKDYKEAVEAINKALTDFDQRLTAIQTSTEQTNEKLRGLTEITPELEAALENVYNAQSPTEYADALARVNQLIDEQASKSQAVDQALSRWGLGWEVLGEKARAQKLGELLSSIQKDYELLTEAGADQAAVLDKMAPKINEYVQRAMKSGTEIPESMRPILERMIELGLLTDENGKKLTDLGGMKFGETFQESTKRIADAVDKLNEALNRIIESFQRMPRTVTAPQVVDPNANPYTAPPPSPYHDGGTVIRGGDARILPFSRALVAHGGVHLAGDEVPAILQTGERVLSRRQNQDYMRAKGRAATGTTNVTIQVAGYLDSKSSGRRLARQVREELDNEMRGRRRFSR